MSNQPEGIGSSNLEQTDEQRALEAIESNLTTPTDRNPRKRSSRETFNRPTKDETDHQREEEEDGEIQPTRSRKAAKREEEQKSNLRLERLRAALDKFLELIDHRASSSNFAKSLPRMKAEVVESLRVQLVEELKGAIKEQNEQLLEEYELGPKLAELQQLADEADQRLARGFKLGSEELKDVWRPDLDIETAISAKAIPAQRERIRKLELELEKVRTANSQAHAELEEILKQDSEKRSEAKEALDSLEQTVQALETSPEMEKELNEVMDLLLKDLGARA
ncbi:hypothetical protein IE53DRAFT_367940 [Violaceomyces palustris]|uniref:Uncharacterized protein n=1 Tax=Violaceomyces palustris TaxID=1673888 RepID=A0ACD0P0N1_9BASI|nr:hypothetical protein IE53DRAFT_367940 [Violaceomyces palustris]